jgi:hypothetical protein
MFKYYVNSLRDEVKEEFQTMGSFMGKGEFIGPKNGKKIKEVKPITDSERSVKETLIELSELNNAGLITDEEYQQKRNEILKRI